MLARHRAIRTHALASGPTAFTRHGTVIDPRDLDDGSNDHYVPEPPRYDDDDYVRSPGCCLGGKRNGGKRGRGAGQAPVRGRSRDHR